MSTPKRNIVWFRRDLRIGDHPALNAAIESSDEVVPVFILDKSQIDEAGAKLLAYMGQSLRALDESLGNRLHIIEGDQVEVLTDLMKLYGATEVHISDEYERYGAARDARVRLQESNLFAPEVPTLSHQVECANQVMTPHTASTHRSIAHGVCTAGDHLQKLHRLLTRQFHQISTAPFRIFLCQRVLK